MQIKIATVINANNAQNSNKYQINRPYACEESYVQAKRILVISNKLYARNACLWAK